MTTLHVVGFRSCWTRSSLSRESDAMKISRSNKLKLPRRRLTDDRSIAGLLRIVFALLIPVGIVIPSAHAQAIKARVGDVTHLQGEGRNPIGGFGIVTGLDRSGDGDSYLPTMRALAQMMERMGAPVLDLEDLKGTKSVAIVRVYAEIPEHGAREGELLDVRVTAIGAAKSLEGGQLLTTPLTYDVPGVDGLFAFASGKLEVEADLPTTGIIRRGARMERDVFMNVIATGSDLLGAGIRSEWIEPANTYITLVLDHDHADWPLAAAIAQAVDAELRMSADVDRVALAVDSKSVVVLLPEHQRADPASWIRDVQQTRLLMESNEARITINRRTGTIVVTGDTRISPVIVSQKGMTITVFTPNADGTVPKPAFEEHDFVPVDVERDRTSNVEDLLEALNRLKVPFEERLAILEEIKRAGKLHAAILYEG